MTALTDPGNLVKTIIIELKRILIRKVLPIEWQRSRENELCSDQRYCIGSG